MRSHRTVLKPIGYGCVATRTGLERLWKAVLDQCIKDVLMVFNLRPTFTRRVIGDVARNFREAAHFIESEAFRETALLADQPLREIFWTNIRADIQRAHAYLIDLNKQLPRPIYPRRRRNGAAA